MKRNILTILLILFLAVPSFSQIQNKFFGATLGYSDINATYSGMYNYFGEKPTMLFGILTVDNQNFAGYYWDAINAHFHNGKFAKLNLRYTGNWKASSQTILRVYNNLKTTLMTKYGGNTNITINNVTKEDVKGIVLFDGRYGLSLELKRDVGKNEYYEVGLWYWDHKLINEPQQPSYNDEL